MLTRHDIRAAAATVLAAVTLAAGGCAAGGGDRARPGAEGGPGAERGPHQVRVAAAANLRFAMEDLAAAFRTRRPDARVEVTYGSSGNLATQIENGAPFDIFFSADAAYPRKLVEKGLAASGGHFLYAVGRIVLWVPRDSPLPVPREGADALAYPALRRLAIANPGHAPYGRAAVAALQALGVYEKVRPKLVLGENVAQAAAFAAGGAADAAVIALSLAVAPTMREKGRHWEFPPDTYPRLAQGGVIPARARHPEDARAFRDFVLSEPGRAILREHGFHSPEEGR